MPRLNLERLKQHKEESSGLGDMGSTALRYMDRAGRLAGLGVGTLGAAATAPLQLIPGVTDWLPEVDEISNAYKAFTDLRKQGDWDAAINIWRDLVNNPDEKIARRSAYNMAIASEIKGGLDTAIEWANKAQKLGEKKAYNYINILQRRKMDEEKLKQQLNN